MHCVMKYMEKIGTTEIVLFMMHLSVVRRCKSGWMFHTLCHEIYGKNRHYRNCVVHDTSFCSKKV